MAAHRDITDRLKIEEAMNIAREKAEASDKLKTNFLNNISHEVRTPLNGILGFAEIISQDDLSHMAKQEALAMVNESSYRLLDTITNYMDISLLISGEMIVRKKELSPDQLLRELYQKFKPACDARNIELSLSLPESSERLIINSDADLLAKIFTQLLNNAVKFTEKGIIQYGYSRRQDKLEFFVSDTGIGIGKEFTENLFNLFVKEERIKTRPNEGSGLGLSVSRRLVELLGENLFVDSEKGKGSRFYFTVPLINKLISAELNFTGPPKHGFRLSTILVSEDDETSFLYIKTILEQSTSAKILHAVNGRDAIEKFRNNPDIDIILMDMKMPEINGLEATLKIKAINPDIPVIAITAYAMVGDEKRILEAGCDSYISKPINKQALLDKIAEFITI
jgi:CheY-like chemotaxis protein